MARFEKPYAGLHHCVLYPRQRCRCWGSELMSHSVVLWDGPPSLCSRVLFLVLWPLVYVLLLVFIVASGTSCIHDVPWPCRRSWFFQLCLDMLFLPWYVISDPYDMKLLFLIPSAPSLCCISICFWIVILEKQSKLS